MKCQNCGYHNKSNQHYCEKCGNPLNKYSSNNPVRKYKDTAKRKENLKTFNTTEKIIIAAAVIAVLMLVLSAAIPSDMDFSKIIPSQNNSQQSPNITQETTIEKLDTKIQVDSIGIQEEKNIILTATVSDSNNNPVISGTASVTLNDVKYSGQVKNGNVNITLPESTKNAQTVTVTYEGNDQYNPSQTTATIEITKQNTQIDTIIIDNTVRATLKTQDNRTISNSTITVTYPDNTVAQQKTDNNGEITININDEDTLMKLSYDGSQIYNPCETTVEITRNKTETKLETQYNQQDETIIIKLTDDNNNPVRNADLTLTGQKGILKQTTDNNGEITVKLDEGENKLDIDYTGNNTYQSSSTTVNAIVSQNENATAANDSNTTGITEGILVEDVEYNDTQNTTDEFNATSQNDSNTQSKENTTIKTDFTDESTLEIQLITLDNRQLKNKNIKIMLENGTVLTRTTDVNGTIKLDIENGTESLEVLFDGDEDYEAYNKTVTFTSGNSH